MPRVGTAARLLGYVSASGAISSLTLAGVSLYQLSNGLAVKQTKARSNFGRPITTNQTHLTQTTDEGGSC